jgi:broad specificity phosphatase PhoE
METIFLARHALAGSNRDGLASCAIPGPGLTPEGVEQATRLREVLASEVIALGIASDLRRTQETLEIALRDREVERLVVPELDEIDFGSFNDGLLSEYRAWAAAEPPDLEAPGGGESRAQAALRFARGLRVVLGRPEQNALVVGHALCLRYFIDAADGLLPAPLMTPLEHATPYRLSATEASAAATLLEEWASSPVFRSS